MADLSTMDMAGLVCARKIVTNICAYLDKPDCFKEGLVTFVTSDVVARPREVKYATPQGVLGTLVLLKYVSVQRGYKFVFSASREQLERLKRDMLEKPQGS